MKTQFFTNTHNLFLFYIFFILFCLLEIIRIIEVSFGHILKIKLQILLYKAVFLSNTWFWASDYIYVNRDSGTMGQYQQWEWGEGTVPQPLWMCIYKLLLLEPVRVTLHLKIFSCLFLPGISTIMQPAIVIQADFLTACLVEHIPEI